jgi:hypothetical protein
LKTTRAAKTILEIEVRGKRGVGYCQSMSGTVRPFERLKARLRARRTQGRERSKINDERVRKIAPSGTDGPHLSEMAARAFQDDPRRGKPQIGS